jgi:molybdenum cofactor cytidylyltransferase
MRLAHALRIRPGISVAFVGAGGKTGAMRRLVNELVPDYPVIVTTTTRLGYEQSDLAAMHVIVSHPNELQGTGAVLYEQRSILVTGPLGTGEPKWLGLDDEQMQQVWSAAQDVGAVLLIEADGARRRSLKAPAAHEPAIPNFVDLVVPVAGIDAVGASLSEEAVHRPELLAKLLGLEEGISLSAQHIADALISTEGGFKRVPPGAEVRLLINKIEDADQIEAGRAIAERALRSKDLLGVVLAAVAEDDPVREVHGRVAGVVLAAGASTRLKRAKQLVRWRGKPLVWHALQAARSGGLQPIVVVVGADGNEVRKALSGEEVIVVENPDWEQGQSTSVRAGLSAIVDQTEGAVFLLSDMPLVGSDLVRALAERHRRTLAPIIVPKIDDRRANPVLFDRDAFAELMDLHGDVGGRALFEHFLVEDLAWPHDVFLDIDTEEDLRRLEAPE